jgi:hypothetical protein
MGKRSSFERIERDFYPTPREAVLPLAAHIAPGTTFVEPCAGNGALIDHLESIGLDCLNAFDIEPQRADINRGDAREILFCRASCFITNPPWSRPDLHAIIGNLSKQAPTWLLFDADWMHTRQSAELMRYCRKIVSVGRVKWIPDSPFTGKDNCCWYLFDQTSEAPAQFIGRAA